MKNMQRKGIQISKVVSAYVPKSGEVQKTPAGTAPLCGSKQSRRKPLPQPQIRGIKVGWNTPPVWGWGRGFRPAFTPQGQRRRAQSGAESFCFKQMKKKTQSEKDFIPFFQVQNTSHSRFMNLLHILKVASTAKFCKNKRKTLDRERLWRFQKGETYGTYFLRANPKLHSVLVRPKHVSRTSQRSHKTLNLKFFNGNFGQGGTNPREAEIPFEKTLVLNIENISLFKMKFKIVN